MSLGIIHRIYVLEPLPTSWRGRPRSAPEGGRNRTSSAFLCPTQVYGGFTWLVTFNTNLGDVSSLTADIKPMTGTAPTITISESVQGEEPSFASLDPYNSLPLGSATLTDLSDLSVVVSGLKEGVAYYFRVRASNYIGPGAKPGLLLFISLRLFHHGAFRQAGPKC